MKEMKKLEESSKIGTLSKEDYEAAAKTQNPIIANYLSAITTLRIAEDNEEDTIINDNF